LGVDPWSIVTCCARYLTQQSAFKKMADKPLKSFILGATTIAEPNYLLVKDHGSFAEAQRT